MKTIYQKKNKDIHVSKRNKKTICALCGKYIEHEAEYLVKKRGFSHFECIEKLEEEKK